jgi:hypothetical protein
MSALAAPHDTAARRAHRNPTPAQAAAGNYRKGHLVLHGLPITIENARGSTRRGIGGDGKPWSVEMPAHYGYLRGTTGADSDHIDCFIGRYPASRHVFVVNQVDAETGRFDELKCLLGYPTRSMALRDYERSFSDNRGRDRIGSVVEMTIEQFKDRLKQPNTFAKAIKRARGGRAGFADGGAPGLPDEEAGFRAIAPSGGRPTGPVTGLSDEDAGFSTAASTPQKGGLAGAGDEIADRFDKGFSFTDPSLIGAAGSIYRGVKNLPAAAMGIYRDARDLGSGEIDPSTPEGSLRAANVAATVLPTSPAMRTGAAIARAAEEGAPAVAPKVTPEAIANQTAADEFGVRLSRGQATGSLDDIRYEDLAAREAYGKPAQDVAAPFFNQQFEDIQGAGRDIGERVARDPGAVAATPSEAASTVNSELSGAASQAQRARDAAAARAVADADATRGIVRDQGQALTEALQEGHLPIENPREAGELVGHEVRTQAATDRQAYQNRYNEAFSLPGEFHAATFEGIGNRIQGALTLGDNPVIIDDVTTPVASRAIRDLDNISNLRIQNRADPFGAPNSENITAVDLRGVDQARKRLTAFYRAARSGGNAADARATGRLIDEFDNQVEGAMSNGLFSGDPQALTALQQARAAYSSYARRYRPQQAGDDVGTAMRRIIDRQATPEEIANMITGSGRLGNAGLPVRLADRLEQVLGRNSDAWSTVRQALWQRASQVRNGVGEIDPARSAQSIQDFSGSSLGRRMFSQQELAAMRAHAQGVRGLDQLIEQSPAAQAAQRVQTGYQQMFGGEGIGGAQQAAFRRIVEGTPLQRKPRKLSSIPSVAATLETPCA